MLNIKSTTSQATMRIPLCFIELVTDPRLPLLRTALFHLRVYKNLLPAENVHLSGRGIPCGIQIRNASFPQACLSNGLAASANGCTHLAASGHVFRQQTSGL